jgi:hypothetical protein
MKPRSTVASFLAITETLLAARAKAARAKQVSVGQPQRSVKPAKILGETRPLLLRIKAQTVS